MAIRNEQKESASRGRSGPGGEHAGRDWLDLTDTELLAQCEVDTYRASGPGGQKRNKTSSAVRLRHKPTSLIVTAVESRSQHENRARALRRLRQAVALSQRNRIQPQDAAPAFYRDALKRDPGLRVNAKHSDYLHIVQHVLDVLFACRASVGDAADALGISTGHLIRFLKEDPKLWEQANRLRKESGHPPLR
jgi:hypothetical protein